MDQTDTTRPKKKRYSKPVFREYGDLRMVTETTPGGKGAPDGGGKVSLKTG